MRACQGLFLIDRGKDFGYTWDMGSHEFVQSCLSCSFSRNPEGGFKNLYEKLMTQLGHMGYEMVHEKCQCQCKRCVMFYALRKALNEKKVTTEDVMQYIENKQGGRT